MGNLGGGALAIPAKDCVLSPVVDLERRLVLDGLRIIPGPGYVEFGCDG
jgi:hypothetical protein